MPVSFITIQSSCLKFELHDIFRDDATLFQQPYLVLKGPNGCELELWDNEDYLLKLFKAIEADFHTSEYLELLETCARYGWKVEEVTKTLNGMFQEAKKLKMFKL